MNNNNFKISIVVPLLNEKGNIEIFSKKVASVLDQLNYELIFVDDGSKDGTLEEIKKLREKNARIHYISFSRNFGHQNALRAGLDFASGDCVVTMDGDMQHPADLIPGMITKWQEGFDIVYTIRKDDPGISFFKKKTSNFFYFIMNRLTDIRIRRGAADFRLIDKNVVQIMRDLKENDLFIRGVVPWVGFNQFGIDYMAEERYWGETKYSLREMIKFAASGITSFSVKPLYLSTLFGYFIAVLSFFYGIYAILMKLLTDTTISGWTSVLVGVFFIGGIQMIMIGILGEYIGKLFIESKRRPNYIIKEKSL